MSSISSLTKAVSGLTAAQKGLQVTGHNISNTNTKGYTRQQLLQSESSYLTIGKNGGYSMQVGLGVTCDEIRQIRDELADKRLRTEKSVLCYYQALNAASTDIESMFDEPYGATVSDYLNDFWSQAQKLSASPNTVEERMSFISAAKVLINKINEVSDQLTDYQFKLDSNIKTSVNRINEITKEIRSLNDKIAISEVNGDNANDYRDQRNVLLDELATYGNISYYEEPSGMIQVQFEGHSIVNHGFEINLELKEIEGSPFSKITWSDTKNEVFDLENVSSSAFGNDSGSLKGLLIARGEKVVTNATTWDDVALNDKLSVDVEGNAFMIPKIQKMLNEFATELVTLVNESFTGTGMGDHLGQDGVPVFVPIVGTDMIAGNIQVNPILLANGGYNQLGTIPKAEDGSDSNKNNVGDNSIIKDFLTKWGTNEQWFNEDGKSASSPYAKTVNLSTFFSELVTEIGSDGAVYIAKTSEKNISVNNIENERAAMGGVSTDEEFSNMLKYQYAYNASARMITMLDGMLDTIINKM